MCTKHVTLILSVITSQAVLLLKTTNCFFLFQIVNISAYALTNA